MANVFNEIMLKDIDGLTDWLDKYGDFDTAPWNKWFDRHYCSKCEPVIADHPDKTYYSCEFAWCELNRKCRFFQDIDDVPDNKFVIRMWLESDDDYEEVCNELL